MLHCILSLIYLIYTCRLYVCTSTNYSVKNGTISCIHFPLITNIRNIAHLLLLICEYLRGFISFVRCNYSGCVGKSAAKFQKTKRMENISLVKWRPVGMNVVKYKPFLDNRPLLLSIRLKPLI